MTVSELQAMLNDYDGDMELYLLAEDHIGNRKMILNVHDFIDRESRVFLSGRLSKSRIPREISSRLY